ncbi:MAG: class I SAM-dependent methyltransferase [Acidobacteriota bacterium]
MPFDGVAKSYDRDFTDTTLGRELRARVWERLAARFSPGARVLELNCGTGEDAAWLAARGVSVVATDGSEAMLAVARRKCRRLGSEERVHFERLHLEEPEADFAPASFDGAFSSFGGLNCVSDLRPLRQSLAQWLKVGAPLILVVMGPICLWETFWHLARGRPRQAFRRWRRDGVEARIGSGTLRVYYPSPEQLARAFAPAFHVEGWQGLGVALPPSLLSRAMEKHSSLRRVVNGLAGRWPFFYLGDHYIMEMRRASRGPAGQLPSRRGKKNRILSDQRCAAVGRRAMVVGSPRSFLPGSTKLVGPMGRGE